MARIPDAFWSRSFQVARGETVSAVARAYIDLTGALEPGATLGPARETRLPRRAGQHLADLGRLHAALDGTLPDELATIRDLLAAPAADAIRRLRVYWQPELPSLNRWQAALVDKLNKDAADPADPTLTACLEEMCPGKLRGVSGSGLARLQADLYRADAVPTRPDDSVQWLGVRDYLGEAEVAAGMVQALLASDASLSPADVGLLFPDDTDYVAALEGALAHGGIAVSGLPAEQSVRDLGREAVFHFLRCARKPAPAMALAACLSSPLMPWSSRDGAVLAQRVMDGDYLLAPFADASPEAGRVLALLREGAQTAAALGNALNAFAACLGGDQDLAAHRETALETVAAIDGALTAMKDIDWQAIFALATPAPLVVDQGTVYTREGVTLWRESQEPWRAVKHLVVLGFCDGHYPAPVPVSPVFSQDDLQAVRDALGWPVELPADVLARRRALFKRQLSATSESVTFLVPRRNGIGDPKAPSESLVFMQELFAAGGETHDLVRELDLAEERAQARHVPLAPAAPPTAPRAPRSDDLAFGRNLLARGNGDALMRQSPSRLETLMVSPLAWLLRRVGAEPALWAPEELGVLLKGTLAHAVFEALFAPGAALPDPDAITTAVREHLGHAIRRFAPFLNASPWQVERRHLERELVEAAAAWRRTLERLGAEVVAAEVWLEGRLGELPIRGQADAILALPGDRLLVVDYKKSSSGSREDRMEQGYDSQLCLYRTMLETGGPQGSDQAALATRLADCAHTGILYCMLNDGSLLSDEGPPDGTVVPGWRAFEDDVSAQAMALIKERLADLERGQVRLNRAGDETFFTKVAGLTPYALDNSPLIMLFALPDVGEALE
ncbi:MAG: PD-(D/E)XK nuclease family protein [Gammaproteobacteria bacterium]|nr:MAG: PD-(D/E)XK nuclease family protein [Gammaproteobacteria bacterium]